jgi:hypothetical protein
MGLRYAAGLARETQHVIVTLCTWVTVRCRRRLPEMHHTGTPSGLSGALLGIAASGLFGALLGDISAELSPVLRHMPCASSGPTALYGHSPTTVS